MTRNRTDDRRATCRELQYAVRYSTVTTREIDYTRTNAAARTAAAAAACSAQQLWAVACMVQYCFTYSTVQSFFIFLGV